MAPTQTQKLDDNIDTNGCEGCHHCIFPGIRWPASPDGYNGLSYVDKCDYCELYATDEEAAKALAAHFGVRWGYANREADDEGAEIRWEPEQDDGLDYTGWSCFIDHEARDGDEKYTRDGKWGAALLFNPGQVKALLAAIQEYHCHIAAEVASGELRQVVESNTLTEIEEMLA